MRPSSRTLLLGVSACAGLFCLILVLAYLSPRARELDARALQGFVGMRDQFFFGLFKRLGHLGDQGWVMLQTAVLAGIAVLRGRPRLAAAVVVLVGVSSVSSQLLKALLAYPRHEDLAGIARVTAEAFPSGHSTAAMALAICGVIVAPVAIRPLAAIAGVTLALSVGFSVLLTGSHFPSDVAGGFLLATGWGLLVALALLHAHARWPERAIRGRAAEWVRRSTDAAATTGLAVGVLTVFTGLAGLGLVIALTRPGDALDFARQHTAALLVGSALAALAVGLLAGITLGLRRRG